MKVSPNHSDDTPTPPAKSTVVLLLGSIADTTWRMFVPSIGMTLLGVAADSSFNTKPWLTLLGIALGVAVTLVLVRNQFKKL